MIALYILAGIFGIILSDVIFLTVLSLSVRKENYDRPNKFYFSVYFFHCKIALFFSNIKITVAGKEKLENIKGKFLIAGNHRSNYDPFITEKALREKIAFISKPENFKIPFFGKIVKKCCYMPIDREDAKNAIRAINRAAELIKSGAATVGVYPEGKRSKGTEMVAFHDGVFKIAQKAECPIVVVAISGTEEIYKRAPFRRTHITVTVADVIYPDDFSGKSSHEISAYTKEKLAEVLDVPTK